MSADNWTTCPKCTKRTETEIQELKEKIGSSYGKVSEKEYNSLQGKLERLQDHSNVDATLREDYEIGVYDSVFEIYYGCQCEQCGFTYDFSSKQDLTNKL